MLRTLVLLVTHLSMLFAGAGLVLVTVHARRQAVTADRAALDVRATFLETTIEHQVRIREHAAKPDAGRHRAPSSSRRAQPHATTVRPKSPSLLTATLADATAILATRRAQRVQERREFVDLMTTAVGPARIRTHAIGHQYADVRVGVA